MRNLKISMLFSVFALFLTFGCQKTAEQLAPVFVENTFYPTGEEDAKARVTTFLDAVEAQKKGVVSRTAFQDMEVNEGRWTLEGAANYEKYANFGVGADEILQTYTMEVNNVTVNNELQMEGADMTVQYAALLGSINSDEQALGKSASAIDLRIVSVNSTSTVLEATVLFEEIPATSTDEYITFPTAARRVTAQANAALGTNGQTWHPNVTILPDVLYGSCPGLISYCMSDGAGALTIKDYYVPWLGGDVQLALEIGDWYLANAQTIGIPPYTDPNFPSLNHVRRLSVAVEYQPVPPGNPYISDAKWLYVNNIVFAVNGYIP